MSFRILPATKVPTNPSHFHTEYLATSAGMLELSFIEGVLCKALFASSPSSKPTIENIGDILELLPSGTPFERAVWQAALAIKPGHTKTYHELAVAIGRPKAYRAVANALGKNPIAVIIPCHRVIRKDGSLGGYKWGIEKKIALLATEKND